MLTEDRLFIEPGETTFSLALLVQQNEFDHIIQASLDTFVGLCLPTYSPPHQKQQHKQNTTILHKK